MNKSLLGATVGVFARASPAVYYESDLSTYLFFAGSLSNGQNFFTTAQNSLPAIYI